MNFDAPHAMHQYIHAQCQNEKICNSAKLKSSAIIAEFIVPLSLTAFQNQVRTLVNYFVTTRFYLSTIYP